MATYHLAPNAANPSGTIGNDGNTGTVGSPWFSLVRAWASIAAGDTVLMRGGTYNYNNMQYLQSRNGTAGNLIKIWAYPGEQPNITRGPGYVVDPGVDQDLIYLEGNYFHFRDIEISNFVQLPGDDPAWSAFRCGFTNNSIFERIKYHDNMAGMSIRGASTGNVIFNSDFYNNIDPYSAIPYDGADGLDLHYIDFGCNNTVHGCRFYWNGDDGLDLWQNNGFVTVYNNWSFYNGFLPGTFSTAGNGSGFKLGETNDHTAVNLRLVRNNIAYRNRSFGFVENAADCKMDIFNNTSVLSGTYGYWFGVWPGLSTTISTLKNNTSWQEVNDIAAQTIVQNNSWQNGHVVSAGDYVSIDPAQLLQARKADGSLPDLTFLNLIAGSDLIDAGQNVGLPFIGAAPDIGHFEYDPSVTAAQYWAGYKAMLRRGMRAAS